ncbi:MAG: sigma-70 family RNA polymerase sigma factor [Candidatus Hydrogenedentota bacterium]
MYTYALSMTRSKEAAEDVVHTVFAEVLSREVLPLELRPYLFRSIRNRAIDAMRKRSRETLSDSIFEYGSDDGLAETRILIEEAMEALGDDEREAVVLKAYSELTLNEIAEARRVSINTAASWYRRGLEKMRKRIEEVPHE